MKLKWLWILIVGSSGIDTTYFGGQVPAFRSNLLPVTLGRRRCSKVESLQGGSSEMLQPSEQITLRHTPENCNLKTHGLP